MATYFIPDDIGECTDESHDSNLKFRAVSLESRPRPELNRHIPVEGKDIEKRLQQQKIEIWSKHNVAEKTSSDWPEYDPFFCGLDYFDMKKSSLSENCDYEESLGTIAKVLKSIKQGVYNFDYEYRKEDKVFKVCYIDLICCVEIRVSLFSNNEMAVVEVNNYNNGDANVFYSFYREFKSMLTGSCNMDKLQKPINYFTKPLLRSEKNNFGGELTKEEISNAHKIMKKMIEKRESRLEATKLIGSLLSRSDESCQSEEFLSQCLEYLTQLLLVSDEDDKKPTCEVKQRAVLALSHITSCKQVPKDKIIKSDAIPIIFNMAVDGPKSYDLIRCTEECVHIMTFLAQCNPRGVWENLTKDEFGTNTSYKEKLESIQRDCDSRVGCDRMFQSFLNPCHMREMCNSLLQAGA